MFHKVHHYHHYYFLIGLFADDVALWTSPTDNQLNNMIQQHNNLQISLNKISEWCNKWKLILSTNKTQYIVFKKPQKRNIPNNLTIELNQSNETTIIQPTKQVKYLGLWLDSSLSFKYHICNYLLPKLNKKLGWLFMVTNKFNQYGLYPHILTYQMLYKMIIRPSIEYASAFWNGGNITYINKLNKIQCKILCRGLKLMNNVSYDSCNVINFIEPIQYRCQQEEIKLLKRSIVYSVHFPNHNLSKIYNKWIDNLPNKGGVLNFKLSTLTRAHLNAHLYDIKLPQIENLIQQPKLQQMPRIIHIPKPTNTPFVNNNNHWPELDHDDVLATFIKNEQRTIIFTDGSCPVNPGYGGAGVVIYPSKTQHNPNFQPITLQYPIDGITTNIAAEIVALSKAIQYIDENIENKKERIIIFSDCKIVIDSVLNRCNAIHYQHAIRQIQQHLNKLINVPEIYWCKAHIGIAGNELADKTAKQAAHAAINQIKRKENSENNNNSENNSNNNSDNNSEFSVKIADEASYLSSAMIECGLIKEWNNEWIKYSKREQHSWCKSIIPTISFAMDLFHKLFVYLKYNELKIITRLISGHVRLNEYMYSINLRDDPYCYQCAIEGDDNYIYYNDHESINHYLLHCSAFNEQRNILYENIKKEMSDYLFEWNFNTQLLLTGYPHNNWHKRINIVKHSIKFIQQTNRMKI